MYELYQTEWCPYSSFVRELLTERGVDFIARQVPANRPDRREMQERTGDNSVPVLVAGDRVISSFEEIVTFVEQNHPAKEDSGAHRERYADPEEQNGRNVLLRRYA